MTPSTTPPALSTITSLPKLLSLLSLLAGGLAILLGSFLSLSEAAVLGFGNYSLMSGISLIHTGLVSILALAAIALGAFGFFMKGGNRIFAVAGAAIGVTLVIGGITSILYSAVIQAVAN